MPVINAFFKKLSVEWFRLRHRFALCPPGGSRYFRFQVSEASGASLAMIRRLESTGIVFRRMPFAFHWSGSASVSDPHIIPSEKVKSSPV
jgi:hypothetical protein